MSDGKLPLRRDGSLLCVRGLRVSFSIEKGLLFRSRAGIIRAVDNVDIAVGDEQRVSLVGEAGCGKTTTARAILGLARADEGEVMVDGVHLSHTSSRELLKTRLKIQMVFSDPDCSLDPKLHVADSISEPLRIAARHRLLSMSDAEMKKRVDVLLDRVGLAPSLLDRYPRELSSDQRQRVNVARALVLDPKIILVDDPTRALEASAQSALLDILVGIQRDSAFACLYMTRDPTVARQVSDQVAIMYLGRIIEFSASDEIFGNPLHPHTEALISAQPAPDPVVRTQPKRVVLTADASSRAKKPVGCQFYDRCPKRMDVCRSSIPQLTEVEPGRQVACYLHFEPEPIPERY
jgi:oligopeptide transport system ATP-binding protein